MKKLILFTCAACFIIGSAKAQLTNTKWKGSLGIQQESGQTDQDEVVWDFGIDTLVLHFTQGGEDEVMTYDAHNKVMTIKKISGGSQCDPGSAGKYNFNIRDNQLFISVKEDSCKGRALIDFSKPFIKVD